MMKIRLLILTAITAMLFIVQASFAQESDPGNVAISEKRAYSIKELLNILEENYAISYQDRLIPFKKKVLLNARTYSVSDLLARICRGHQLKFQINNQQIFLAPRKERARINRNLLSTLKGTITNASNGEVIIGASISVNESKGVTSNGYGFYSMSLPHGTYDIIVSHTAFEKKTIQVPLNNNQTLNLQLTEKVDRLPEVVVQGRQTRENITGVIPGVNTLNYRNKGDIPYFLGEVDVLQSSLLLPGINNLGEDSNGINIRGGSTSQNLILLDEAVIFNSSHIYGLISVFNPESVNDVEIFKGSMPARYGGRTSSVINIRQREGNDKQFNVAGGIGLVAGRLTVEGPIIKEKASFLVSARRSFLDLSGITSFDPERADFLDLNFKVNYRINDRNKIFLSGYFGNDRNENNLDQFRKWGNRTMTLRWNHVINGRLFMNTSAIFSEYTYRVTNLREAGSFQGTSRIINSDVKTDFSYYLAENQLINFGGGINVIKSNPGDRLPLPESGATNPVTLDTEVAVLPYLYAEKEGKFGQFQYNFGLRLTSFHNIGPEDVLLYDGENRSVETV
ncbi:MAG: TonB-dependent receptor, partial [Bacteroidota bacterium]